MMRATPFLAAVAALAAGAAHSVPPMSVASAPVSVSIAPTAGDKSQLEKQDIRAQLSPRRFTTLSSELGAKINRLSVKEGESFHAGQVLVAFDCSLQQAQLQRAQAALSAAEKAHAGNRKLSEMNSVGKLELDMSDAEVAKTRADVRLITATLGKCNIAAPFAGRVAEQKAREQQFAQPGQPLLEIIDDSSLELEFIVPSRWLGWMKIGQAFQVRIDETGSAYPARITRIGARVDPVSQSVKAMAVIDGRNAGLVAGMSGQILLRPPAER